MAKPGPKGTTNIIKMNKGTYQPCRNKEEVREPIGDNSDLECPDWLPDNAKEIWHKKLKKFDESGVNVSIYNDAFAHYCAIDAAIREVYKNGEVPSMAMVSQHRIWAAEFFDTPASGHMKKPSKESEKKNGFASL